RYVRDLTRVRGVSVAHSDCNRWGVSVPPLTMGAGEDIRWRPRHVAGGISFPAADYWLFDDRRVVFTVFHPDGRFLGGAESTDPGIIGQCRQARQQAWALAIPHDTYVLSGNCPG